MTQTEITLIVNHDDLDDHWMILIIFSAPVRSLPAADTADTDCSSSRLHGPSHWGPLHCQCYSLRSGCLSSGWYTWYRCSSDNNDV